METRKRTASPPPGTPPRATHPSPPPQQQHYQKEQKKENGVQIESTLQITFDSQERHDRHHSHGTVKRSSSQPEIFTDRQHESDGMRKQRTSGQLGSDGLRQRQVTPQPQVPTPLHQYYHQSPPNDAYAPFAVIPLISPSPPLPQLVLPVPVPHTQTSSASDPAQVPVSVKYASTESGRIEKEIKICDIIKIPVPKVIVCRIFGVTSSESVGELMYKYFVMKLPIFLADHWMEEQVQEAVSKIREAVDESKVKDLPAIPSSSESKEKVIEALIKFVHSMTGTTPDPQKKAVVPAFIRLRSMIVTFGMKGKDIENSHVYDDIPPAFRVWTESGIRIATISSSTKDAQRDYMTFTNHGDITPFITETISLMNPHIHTGDPKNPDLRNMCKKVLLVEPPTVLMLTSKVSEAKAGQKAGMEVVLVSREERIGKRPLSEIKRDSVKDIPIVKSMQSIVLLK